MWIFHSKRCSYYQGESLVYGQTSTMLKRITTITAAITNKYTLCKLTCTYSQTLFCEIPRMLFLKYKCQLCTCDMEMVNNKYESGFTYSYRHTHKKLQRLESYREADSLRSGIF